MIRVIIASGLGSSCLNPVMRPWESDLYRFPSPKGVQNLTDRLSTRDINSNRIVVYGHVLANSETGLLLLSA